MLNKINNNDNLASEAVTAISSAGKGRAGKIEQLLSYMPFFFKNREPVVAVLRLNGVIGKVSGMRSGLSLEGLNELIEKTFNISKLTAVCLVVNSPGGSPVQSELIAKRIISLAKEKKVTVYSFVEDVAASGGYWLACAGHEIYASKSSIVGSIGVVSSSFGFHDAINKLGIERRIYTEGKNKSVLDPFEPVKPADVKIIKQLQKQIHEHFISYVKERRGGKLTQSDEILFNGEFWAGLSALDLGLIDGIDEMYSFIKRTFGDDVKIEYIASKQSWLRRRFSMIFDSKVSDNFTAELADSMVEKLESKLIENRFNLM